MRSVGGFGAWVVLEKSDGKHPEKLEYWVWDNNTKKIEMNGPFEKQEALEIADYNDRREMQEAFRDDGEYYPQGESEHVGFLEENKE